MDCEMCGREEAVIRASIEGTALAVCENCGKYGKMIGHIVVPVKTNSKKSTSEKTSTTFYGGMEIIVPEFGSMLKQKREKLGLKQDEFAQRIAVKESALHHMETGQVKPKIEEAKRIGKMLGLKLVEVLEEGPAVVGQQRKDVLTLGDMIKVKKK